MKRVLLLSLFIMMSVFSFVQSSHAQTTTPTAFSLEFGADAYNASKYPNGSLTVLWGGKTRSYTTVDLHATHIVGQFTYDARTGVEQSIFKNASLEFVTFAQAGIAVSDTATSGIFTGGVGIVLASPKFLKGWQPVLAAEAQVAPSATGNSPIASLRVGLRKTFQ